MLSYVYNIYSRIKKKKKLEILNQHDINVNWNYLLKLQVI